MAGPSVLFVRDVAGWLAGFCSQILFAKTPTRTAAPLLGLAR